jgi:hypothetical protein
METERCRDADRVVMTTGTVEEEKEDHGDRGGLERGEKV